MKVNIICVGKLKEKFYISACDEYIKRLNRYCELKVIELNEEFLPDNAGQLLIDKALIVESEKIIKCLEKNTYVITMCIEGKTIDSVAFSQKLDEIKLNGFGSITFVIGSSNGLSDNIKQLSSFKMSMSPMTFPHHLARVMLLEQVYRAFQISNNGKYHK